MLGKTDKYKYNKCLLSSLKLFSLQIQRDGSEEEKKKKKRLFKEIFNGPTVKIFF